MICPICNRPLKSKKSIERGIGPVCAKKEQERENEPPEGQLSFTEETVLVIK
ncbi:DUF6011 domain-containing protein [Sutcliffiella halmapala]|uniref:DUF6011 domain-containing protein n=1 Tax=Sutcliffiella halmapala TaxID=79882 RepID=UPI001475FF02|nr:DUF6011 domain-containing protein [Sutcliffiella halmapala]